MEKVRYLQYEIMFVQFKRFYEKHLFKYFFIGLSRWKIIQLINNVSVDSFNNIFRFNNMIYMLIHLTIFLGLITWSNMLIHLRSTCNVIDRPKQRCGLVSQTKFSVCLSVFGNKKTVDIMTVSNMNCSIYIYLVCL